MKIITTQKYAQTIQTNKIDRATKNKIAGELKASGLDGNGRFQESDSGVRVIGDVLTKYNLSMDMATKDMFIGPSGMRRFSILSKNTSGDAFTPGQEIKNSMVVYSWTEMGPGKFEIVVYLS